ncbi:MAG: flagellar protein FlaG [Clostridiales bacterium]|nr:flagellar protein FlaG [Clostridiales bacterium]MCF8021726.1 flagellar protein FlaG [Clostridiales bacterium]
MKIQGVEPSDFISSNKTNCNDQAKYNFRKTIKELQNIKENYDESKQKLTKEDVKDAVERLNETMETYRTNLRFHLHEESHEWQVAVINAKTEEVIRKIPPDKTLDMVAYVKEMLGLLVDEFV